MILKANMHRINDNPNNCEKMGEVDQNGAYAKQYQG